MKKIILGAALAAAILTGCGTATVSQVAKNGSILHPVFPENSTNPSGIYITASDMRLVAPGQTKDQLYKILGAPHFHEGVWGVREWDYILHIRDDAGRVQTCRFKVGFDQHHRAQAFYWSPSQCRHVLDVHPPAPAPIAVQALAPTKPVTLATDGLFAFDRWELTTLAPANQVALDHLASQVLSNHAPVAISVDGYTDRIGTEEYNRTLSERRAASIREYLISVGVPAASITASGHGPSAPVVECPDQDRDALIQCLAPNRRIVVTVLPTK